MENLKEIPVYYCNGVNIRLSIFDVFFVFGQNHPKTNPETKKIEPDFKPDFNLFMSPQHFKALVKIMNDNLKTYEEKFGIINDSNITKVENE